MYIQYEEAAAEVPGLRPHNQPHALSGETHEFRNKFVLTGGVEV